MLTLKTRSEQGCIRMITSFNNSTDGNITVIAMAEVGRSLRVLNIAFALYLMAASILIRDPSGNALWIAIASSALLIALCFPKGRIRERYGTFDKYLF